MFQVNNAFALTNEKQVKGEVSLMSWSPKFDLLAVATTAGELLLYRLESKERIWSIRAPENGVGILSLCWRFDGKVIVVSYDSVKYGVHFICMESHTRLRQFSLDSGQPATMLKWFCTDGPQATKKGWQVEQELSSKEYLPTIPVWELEPKENVNGVEKYAGEDNFNILLLCDGSCRVTLLVSGILPIVRIHCSEQEPAIGSCLMNAHMPPTMDSVLVGLTRQVDHSRTSAFVLMYDLKTVHENILIYQAIAERVHKILSLESYLESTLNHIGEQCDLVAQEMDSHLVSYLSKTATSDSIGDHFMQLLMWGKATDALKNILTDCLTKRDIKKLGTLIESSYINIQQNLTINFQNALTNLYYHLTEIKGIAAAERGILSFSVEDVERLLKTVGSFLLKTAELLLVIDASLKNFKAFFRWLYFSMLKMQDEQVEKVMSLSNVEMIFVADFIHENLCSKRESGPKKIRQFQIERVYQYLKDEPLSWPMKRGQNEWTNFVSSNVILSSCKLTIHSHPEMSLRQIFNEMSSKLNNIIRQPLFQRDDTFSPLRNVEICRFPSSDVPRFQFWYKKPGTLVSEDILAVMDGNYVMLTNNDGRSHEATLVSLCETADPQDHIKGIRLRFESSSERANPKNLYILDFEPYNDHTVSCLLQEADCATFLAQLDLFPVYETLKKEGAAPVSLPSETVTLDHCGVPLQDFSAACTDVQKLSSMVGYVSLACSGSRKVACVLSNDRHSISSFMMDSKEDEEDIGDSDLSISTIEE